jgi:hypothetical protein
MQLNKYNFLRWFDSTPDTGLPDVPVAYWRDRESCGYMPIGLPTEGMSFYINKTTGLDVTVYNYFSDLRLALVRADNGTIVHNNLGPLQQHFIDAPTNAFYNIYCTLVVPTATVGVHYFKIYRNSTGVEVFRSSYILVRTDQTVLLNTTTYARFRHDRLFYFIKYADLPGFHQQFRLDMSQIERQNEGDKEIYREITTGKQRELQNFMSRYVKLETYYFDPAAHEAAAVMFNHSYIELNSKQYQPKNAYKEPSNPLGKVGKGEMELWDVEFSTVNRC